MTVASEHTEASDSQASTRKLHEDLQFANTLLSSVEMACGELKRQLTACRAELADAQSALAVRTGTVAALEAERDRLREAYHEALELIKILHGEPGWTTYHDHSPEMKRIRTALEPTK